MGLKQKDILARFALTAGEYEDLERNLVKYLENRSLDMRDRHRATLALEGARKILGELEKVDKHIRAWWDLTENFESKPTVLPSLKPQEGDIGTWSHCGNRKRHAAHTHTVVMNEGPHSGVRCNGAP